MKTLLSLSFLFVMVTVAQADHHESESAASPEHGVLQMDVGDWDAVIKMWMPGAPEPVMAHAVESNKMLPGGMWLLSQMEGDCGGQAFHGRGSFGFDPVTKKYVGTWVDNMSPHMMRMEGTFDDATSTMTMHAEAIDPMTGQPGKTKTETVYADGKRVMTMWKLENGEARKHMEITYTRQSS